MSHSGLAPLESTLQATYAWVHQLMEELDWDDRHRGYQALRAVLHALRDQLSVGEVAALGAQLPMLVRGLYYEGWHPSATSSGPHKKGEFLAQVAAAFRDGPHVNTEAVARAVFAVLGRHVTPGELADVKRSLPGEVRSLWPS
jgi:uncharacterized protein (DUF2267 family)